jgi:hypothetical protein
MSAVRSKDGAVRQFLCAGLLANVTLCLPALTACAVRDGPLDRVYTDPQYTFRLVAPDSGWVVTDATGIPEVLVIVKSQTTVEGFIPNVTVTIEPLTSMMTPEAYAQRNLGVLSAQGCEMISSSTSVVNQNRFYELRCRCPNEVPPVLLHYLCLVKDRIGYVITCTVPEQHYESIEGDFDSIVRSFRFVG